MKDWKKILLSIVSCIYLHASIAHATPILLYNTGVDDNGQVLNGGAVDPHYSLISSADSAFAGPEAYVVNDGWPLWADGPWLPNSSDSKWISHRSDVDSIVGGGTFVYQTTFDLTGFDLDTAIISGRWATDNEGLDILINGSSTGLTNIAQFTSFTGFTIDQGFIAGLNTLDFIIYNIPFPFEYQSQQINPAGLRVELSGVADPINAVPEPATIMLLGTGIAALSVAVRKKRDGGVK